MKCGRPQGQGENQNRRHDRNHRNAQLLAPDFHPPDGLRKQQGKRSVLEFVAERESRQQRDAEKNPIR